MNKYEWEKKSIEKRNEKEIEEKKKLLDNDRQKMRCQQQQQQTRTNATTLPLAFHSERGDDGKRWRYIIYCGSFSLSPGGIAKYIFKRSIVVSIVVVVHSASVDSSRRSPIHTRQEQAHARAQTHTQMIKSSDNSRAGRRPELHSIGSPTFSLSFDRWAVKHRISVCVWKRQQRRAV